MGYLIRDITTENAQALFGNDVKLTWYPTDKDNAVLAGSYLWTSQQIGDELPTAKGLDDLCDAFRFENVPRRLVWLAMYGHGKSHLALALANFFGQPAGSAEVESVLNGLDRPERLISFKEQRPRHLVLRLFGDAPQSLAQSVVQGLETALHENPETANASLGLWFDPALQFLSDLDPADKAKAEDFLKTHNLTVDRLKAELAPSNRDDQHREVCYLLFAHLHKGVRPDFGSDFTPEKVLLHTAEQFCGDDKTFKGILILFDEFGVFLQKYAGDYTYSGRSKPLQSLLNAVDTLRERAVFVGFAQYDPDITANKMLAGDTQSLADLTTELNRLPKNHRKRLASPLEAILADYLRQDTDRWRELLTSDLTRAEDVSAAIDLVPLLFPNRYTTANGWKIEKLTDMLGRRCFPMHPLTTALLCSAALRPTETARPILGFVRKKMEQWNDQPALRPDGRLNWVYPIELAAYFNDSLAQNEDAWRRYVQTRENVGPEVESTDRQRIVTAMFVFEAASLAVGSGLTSYENTLAALSGCILDEVHTLLEELRSGNFIKRDEAAKKYKFWPLGEDGSKAQKQLDAEVAQLLPNPTLVAETLKSCLAKISERTIEVTLGHPEDWAAVYHLVPQPLWTSSYLSTLLQRIELSPNKQQLHDAKRGFFLRAVGSTDAEVAWLQAHAADELEQALFALTPQAPPPVLLGLPNQPQAGLIKALVELQVLHNWGKNTREEIGEQPYNQLFATVKEQLKQEHDNLKKQENQLPYFQVPTVYQERVELLLGGKKNPSAKAALKACYDVAYLSYAPFLPDKTNSTNFRQAVYRGCRYLLKGSFTSWHDEASGRDTSLYNTVLKVSATSWGVVDAADQVSVPTLEKVKLAWDVLDTAVPAGSDHHSLREPLVKLLNAPFGYDYYALALLLSAWAGYHRHQVRFFNGNNGNPVANTEWLGSGKNMQQTVGWWLTSLDLRAMREDKGVLNARIEELLDQLASDAPLLTEAAADISRQELLAYAENETGDTLLRTRAHEGAELLNTSLKLAHQATESVTQLQHKLGIQGALNPTGLRHSVDLMLQTRQPLATGRVSPNAATHLPALEVQALSKLRTHTKQTCAGYETAKTEEKYGSNKDRLNEIRDFLAKVKDDSLSALVAESLSRLEKAYTDATAGSKDIEFKGQLKDYEKRRNLAELLECLPILESHVPHAPATAKSQQEVLAGVQKRIEEARTWLQTAYLRTQELTTLTPTKKLADELRQAFAKYENTPEVDTLNALAEHADRLIYLLGELEDLKTRKPLDAKQLQNIIQRYDQLLQIPHLSPVQQQLVQDARQKKQDKFEERVQAAETKLADLETRHAAGQDSAAVLLDGLQQAKLDGLRFLPLDSHRRIKPLESALKKRIGEDVTEEISLLYLRIDDPKQRKACIDKLNNLG